MSKVYKGYELLKSIADGEIKEGSRFDTYKGIVYFDGINLREDNAEGHYFTEIIDDLEFSKLKFELIEDEIDIDNIEEIDIDQVINTDDKTGIALLHINKLIRAVKQLNKEIKELNKKYCCNCGVELTEENTALPNMCNECKYGEEWEQC